ncbi:endonuclease/exonuclease/phosphatase family protein [Luedemannella flava]|uniref:Endonuclease/exonuclease/phosphatase family protein n=1 Tax=Luedemannella flava TaxID=349316 RepID=A0ABN2LU41_9ACTN
MTSLLGPARPEVVAVSPPPAPAAPADSVTRPPRWRRAAGRVTLVATGLWLGYVVTHPFLSGRFWWMLLPDLAPPFLFVAMPLVLAALVPLASCRRVRAVTALLATVALLAGVPQAGLRLPGGAPTVPAGAIKVVSWNTQFWEQDEDPAAFYDYLRRFDADVYLLQEYLYFTDAPRPIDKLAEIKREFPGYEIVANSELITLSRLPIVSSRALDGSAWLSAERGSAPPPGTDFLPYWTTKTLRTDIVVGGGTVAFYNVHIPVQLDGGRSPFTGRFYSVIREQSARREASWRALTADLDTVSGPALVSGDFNSTSAMGELDVLRDRLRQQEVTSGGLYPSTWDARGHGWWRLDHVFAGGSLDVYTYDIRDSAGLSDHKAQELKVGLRH